MKLSLLFLLLSFPAYAASTAGNISATVIAPPASITQADDGTVRIEGSPQYCEKNSDGIICYY